MNPTEFEKQLKFARAGRPCLFYIPKNKNQNSAQGLKAFSHFGSAWSHLHASRDVQQVRTVSAPLCHTGGLREPQVLPTFNFERARGPVTHSHSTT